jgi:hypothetical protein
VASGRWRRAAACCPAAASGPRASAACRPPAALPSRVRASTITLGGDGLRIWCLDVPGCALAGSSSGGADLSWCTPRLPFQGQPTCCATSWAPPHPRLAGGCCRPRRRRCAWAGAARRLSTAPTTACGRRARSAWTSPGMAGRASWGRRCLLPGQQMTPTPPRTAPLLTRSLLLSQTARQWPSGPGKAAA